MYVDTVVSGHGGDRHCRPHPISRRIPEEDEDGDGQGSGPNIESKDDGRCLVLLGRFAARYLSLFLKDGIDFWFELRLERGRGLRRLADYHLLQSPRCS